MARPIPFTLVEDHCVLRGASDAGAQFTVGADPLLQCDEVGVYVVFGPTAMSGRVVIETAPSVGYNGAWHLLDQITWRGPHDVQARWLTGIYLALRVRVVDPIVNGTVDVFVVGS